jgi:Fibronectin type III domain
MEVFMRYPKSEAGRIILAQQVIAGLTANSELDTGAPVKAAALQTRLDGFIAKRNAATLKEAESVQATQDKDDELELFDEDLKSDLRFLELKAKKNEALLNEFGWGLPDDPTKLEKPGQPRTLEAPAQGAGFLFLDWKEAIDGGAVVNYKVQRRTLPNGVFEVVDSSIPSEITLLNQPRGVELEFRVIAVNKAGESVPSNTISVVL